AVRQGVGEERHAPADDERADGAAADADQDEGQQGTQVEREREEPIRRRAVGHEAEQAVEPVFGRLREDEVEHGRTPAGEGPGCTLTGRRGLSTRRLRWHNPVNPTNRGYLSQSADLSSSGNEVYSVGAKFVLAGFLITAPVLEGSPP